MTDCPYSAQCLYFLISVYEIPGLAEHTGILQVGDTSFNEFSDRCKGR